MSDPEIVGTTIQRHLGFTYVSAICPNNRTFCDLTGGIRDWCYNVEDCPGLGGNQFCECSEPDPEACPEIGGTRGTVSWISDATDDNHRGQGRPVHCTYKVSDFHTPEDVCKWKNTFYSTAAQREANQMAYDTLMVNYCAGDPGTGTCPPLWPPIIAGSTGCPGGMTGCSRFNIQNGTSTCNDGNLCRTWLGESQLGATATASAAANFCASAGNICAQDCLCYNREVDPLFVTLTTPPDAAPPESANCWYIPCQPGGVYLTPIEDEISLSTCPAICEQVNNVFDNKGSTININVAQEFMSCGIGGQTGGGDQPISQYWNSIYGWILIGGFILLIIVLACIFVGTRKPSTQDIQQTTSTT